MNPQANSHQNGKDIYKSGRYIYYFSPEDRKNPFQRLYRKKLEDVSGVIDGFSGKLKVLDVGGGMGRLSLILSQKKSLEVFLGDISLDMIKLSKNYAGEDRLPELVNLDAESLPFKTSSFHIVVGLDLFCHLKHRKSALREFHRVLGNDGVLILDSTNSNPLWTIFYPKYLGINPVKWLKAFLLGGILPGWEKLVRHYRKAQFVSFLNKEGFRVESIKKYGPLICPKWHLAVARKLEEKTV